MIQPQETKKKTEQQKKLTQFRYQELSTKFANPIQPNLHLAGRWEQNPVLASIDQKHLHSTNHQIPKQQRVQTQILSHSSNQKEGKKISGFEKGHAQKISNQKKNDKKYMRNRNEDLFGDGKRLFFKPIIAELRNQLQYKRNQQSQEEQRLSIQSLKTDKKKNQQTCEILKKYKGKKNINVKENNGKIPPEIKVHTKKFQAKFIELGLKNTLRVPEREEIFQNKKIKENHQINKRLYHIIPDSPKNDEPDSHFSLAHTFQMLGNQDISIEAQLERQEENLNKKNQQKQQKNRQILTSQTLISSSKKTFDVLNDSLKKQIPRNSQIKKSFSTMIKKQNFQQPPYEPAKKKQIVFGRRWIPQMIEQYYIRPPQNGIEVNIYQRPHSFYEQRSKSSPIHFTFTSSHSQSPNRQHYRPTVSRQIQQNSNMIKSVYFTSKNEDMRGSISQIKMNPRHNLVVQNISYPSNFTVNQYPPEHKIIREDVSQKPITRSYSQSPYSFQPPIPSPKKFNIFPQKIPNGFIKSPFEQKNSAYYPVSLYGLAKVENTQTTCCKMPSKKKLEVFGRISKKNID